MKKLIITIALMSTIWLSDCGTISKIEKQDDGTYKEIPIKTCKTFARDLTYSETTTDSDGTIHSVTYSTKGTTASVIGAGAQLAGAVSNLSPF